MIEKIQDTVWEDILYNSFHILGFIVTLIFHAWNSKKRKVPLNKSLLSLAVVYGAVYLWMYVHYWIESGFTDFGGKNIVRGIVYIPLIAYPVARIANISWIKLCDMLAPCVCLAQGVSRFGCVFTGCCRGYPCEWGIYNDRYDGPAFPVQLFEATTILIIFAILLYRSKKLNFADDSKSYPLMMILFGFSRFLWEFARNNKKIWLGCSSLSFHALFMAVVGVIAMIWITYKSKQKLKEKN